MRQFAKRAFDIAFSSAVILITSPLFLILAILIRLTSKGPVIYFQQRIGKNGIPFNCYKFRTMYPNAEERLKDLLKSDPALKREWEQNFKLKNDPRIIPVGKFLRSSSLDELPQFWNVLKGDLSVVGPRPVIQDEITKHFGPKAQKILSVRPGITGLWQVSGRSNTTYAERVALDEKYVDTCNLALDLKIIARTIPSMLRRTGAY